MANAHTLEQTRALHEELERMERLIVQLLLEPAKTVRALHSPKKTLFIFCADIDIDYTPFFWCFAVFFTQ